VNPKRLVVLSEGATGELVLLFGIAVAELEHMSGVLSWNM